MEMKPDAEKFIPIYMYQWQFSETSFSHERKIYGILDLLGDYGGVMQVFLILAELLLRPVSEHSFLMKAISKLFLASTVDKNLFKPKTNEKVRRKQ